MMNEQQILNENDFLFGVGHPLLDVALDVDDKFLSNYHLKADDAILAQPEHKDLVEYCFTNHLNQLKLIAGGATQNSIRTAQWVFNFYDRKQTFFFGSVGNDQYAKLLEDQAKKDNVIPLYSEIRDQKAIDENNNNLKLIKNNNDHIINTEEDNQLINDNNKSTSNSDGLDCFKTGICLAFTNNGLYRSMVTFLGAARQLNTTHLDKFMDKLEKSSIVYCGGFLLSSSFELVKKIGQYCHENDKKFALNLSAPYVCSTYSNLIAQLILDLDLIFGNEKEIREFSNYHQFGTDDLREICLKIFDKYPCRNKEQLIIITQNKDAVICFMRSNRLGLSQNVPKINKDEIIDTIGGGDAFAGGFLAYYLMNKDIDLCLKCGIYCAREIIKKTGCNFENIKFDEQSVIDLFNPKN